MSADERYRQATSLRLAGRMHEARDAYRLALDLAPDHRASLSDLGVLEKALGAPREAALISSRLIALDPGSADAHYNRGAAFVEQHRLDLALPDFDRAVRLGPDHAQAWSDRGFVLWHMVRLDDAEASFTSALKVQPGLAPAWCNLGNVLWQRDRLDDALFAYDRALALEPAHVVALNNRANLLRDMRRIDGALEGSARAISTDPTYAMAYWNRGLIHLLRGEFEAGWALCEWRKRLPNPIAAAEFDAPLWRGEAIAGKTLFVHCEQGLGDIIQYCRYLPLVQAMGARVVFAVEDVLARLLGDLGPAIEIVGMFGRPAAFDYHIPLISLPLALGTRMESIPADVPYLRAESYRVEQWRKRIGGHGFKIGVCWQGKSVLRADNGWLLFIDNGRAFPLRLLEGVSLRPGVRLISLQKGAGLDQLEALPPGMKVEILGEDFDAGRDAFLDTAAVMENLDLVISSDTSIAHLAGALARPVWLALKYVPDWRWFLDRSDSPWYPTMRLFRQRSIGDWGPVFADMTRALAEQGQCSS